MRVEPSSFPTLQTPRLILREIVADDADALFSIHGDADRMKWFGTDPLPDRDTALRLVDTFAGWRQMANPGTRWGIEVKGRPGLGGSCGLFAWNRSWRKCALGYELARELEGQGYMSEALRRVIEWGWAEMALNRIEAQVHPDNAGSMAVLVRLGFVQEGRLRQVGYWGGRFHDMYQYGLLREDWAPPPAQGLA
ncbi:GNAT family protein [Ideonella sp. DXS29W]|uniref:GNAT family protein n=1 Tax=Ideonella lacteola TaxID=2984193 RepID=A0ABU9BUS2_9BURK